MSTTIVGAGLAGLAAAIKIKLSFSDENVILVEKSSPQSNTQIAGQRIRAGIAGKRQDPEAEIRQLLASRNDGIVTPAMEHFSRLSVQELQLWHHYADFVQFVDRPEWFGPQWGKPNDAGKGRGKSVLDWYRAEAKKQGVLFFTGEAQQILREGQRVTGIMVQSEQGIYRVESDRYILAGGNISGNLYVSTNKEIRYSPHELAFGAGLALVDSTIHMIHPFGNYKGLGCFETDELAGVRVYLNPENPVLDEKTTQLLEDHQAHYQFPDIAKRFNEHGSVVLLEFPNGERKLARVSHHYGHIGIETTDGISVRDTTNLFAIGDASGLGYWTNHHERFPGFALLKILVDAELVRQRMTAHRENNAEGHIVQENVRRRIPEGSIDRTKEAELKAHNTEWLHRWMGEENPQKRGEIGKGWLDALQQSDSITHSTLRDVSITMAYAHWKIGAGEEHEPLRLDKTLLERLQDEALVEVRREVRTYPSSQTLEGAFATSKERY